MEQKDYTEIDLREIVQILWKRKWVIILITLVAVLSCAIISFFILTPQYQASTEILVNQIEPEGLFNQGDIRTNIELINTYSVIIKSPRILDLVIEEYDFNMTYQSLHNMIKVGSVRNSQVMSVTVTHPNYEQAALIANAIAYTFQREIIELMNIDNVHIMAEAKDNGVVSPVKPKPYINVAIAFMVGVMVAIGLVFLLEYLDNTIKTENDVENFLGLPVLGSIAVMDEKTDKKLKASLNKQAQVRGEQLEI